MSIITCSTEVIATSPLRVWNLISDPDALARWTGTKLRTGPGHHAPLRAGDRLELGAGPGGVFSVGMQVVDAALTSHLSIDVQLPLGVVNHELITISPASAQFCRVTLN